MKKTFLEIAKEYESSKVVKRKIFPIDSEQAMMLAVAYAKREIGLDGIRLALKSVDPKFSKTFHTRLCQFLMKAAREGKIEIVIK